MKYSLFFIALAGFAQSVTTSYTTDLNGKRVANSTIVEDGKSKTEISQSVNGRKVPLESTEERVVSQSSSGRVIETITKKFDPNGGLVSTERVVTQEEKTSDGMRINSTIFKGDINGNMRETERRAIETHAQGQNTSMQMDVSKPDLNGSFQTVEKRTQSTQSSGGGSTSDETVYRRSENGSFYAAGRDISETSSSGGGTTVKSAHYEPRDSSQLTLTGQTVTSTVKRADGSTVSEVSLYGLYGGDGRARDRQAAPTLREQQTIERVTNRDGSVSEIVTARRPTTADPSRLGPSQKISETVCTGKCGK